MKMWEIIQKKNPLWFFDATGSILQQKKYQKLPYLYSIVVFDTELGIIAPVAEFISSAHDQNTIAFFLFRILLYFKSEVSLKCAFQYAPVIVVDFSWALINAVNQVFNNSDSAQYIQFCYTALFDEENKAIVSRSIHTRIYICSTHFFKIIIKRTKRIECNEDLKTFFVLCFTLLQNSITVKEFKEFLMHIFIVFNAKLNTNLVKESYDFLKMAIACRESLSDIDDEALIDKDFDGEKANLFSNQKHDNLEETSPFTNYFKTF